MLEGKHLYFALIVHETHFKMSSHFHYFSIPQCSNCVFSCIITLSSLCFLRTCLVMGLGRFPATKLSSTKIFSYFVQQDPALLLHEDGMIKALQVSLQSSSMVKYRKNSSGRPRIRVNIDRTTRLSLSNCSPRLL